MSQILPVLTELLHEEAYTLFLSQQPEVHLHLSAEAELGSIFCKVVEKNKQILVETHSDYLMDRIRTDIRDKKTKITPDDFSILFFEQKGLESHIHSINIDQEGNVLNAPKGYRDFFMKEFDRSLGFIS